MKSKYFIAYMLIIFVSCRTDQGSKLPEFDILLTDSVTTLNTKNISDKKPILVVQFSADCYECQIETESILKNIDSLQDVSLYFITYEKFDRLKIFYEHFKFENYPDITIGQDYREIFQKHMNSRATPLLVLYGRDKQKKAVIAGSVGIKKLFQVIKEYKGNI